MFKSLSYRHLFENIKKVYNKDKWIFGICIGFIIFSFPNLNGLIESGLDSSWKIFLNFANYKGAVWGKDTFFTYGPLGFLEVPRNIGCNLLIANLFWLMVYFIHICVIFNIARNRNCNRINRIMAVLGLVLCIVSNVSLNGNIADSLYLCLVIFYLLYAVWKGERQYIVTYNILMTISFYVKFSSFLTSAIVLFVYSIFKVLTNQKVRDWIELWICAPLSVIVYLIYNPSIKGLYRYCRGAYEISTGYNYAMSVADEGSDESVFWVVIGVICCMVMLALLWNIAKEYIPIFGALISSLFFYYKEGFVRHGGHICFLGVAAIFALIFFSFDISHIITIASQKQKRILIVSTGIVIAICCSFSGNFIGNGLDVINTRIFYYPIDLIKSMNDHGQCAGMLSDNFKEEIGTDTVTIFPWEISYAVDEEINFAWMPIIQNYSSYTEWCDSKNAEYFADDVVAPTYIVFSFEAIDGRFPLIETPRTWHAIKSNYEYVNEEGGKYLLKRKTEPTQLIYDGEYISSNTVSRKITKEVVNKTDMYSVQVPPEAKFFSIEADLGLLGQLQKLFWKVSPVYMEMKCEDGSVLSGRVLLDMLNTPISVDEIGRYWDYNAAVADEPQRIVTQLKFTGDGADAYKEITINWYKALQNY